MNFMRSMELGGGGVGGGVVGEQDGGGRMGRGMAGGQLQEEAPGQSEG